MEMTGNIKLRKKIVMLNVVIVTLAVATVTVVSLTLFQKELTRQITKDQESRGAALLWSRTR